MAMVPSDSSHHGVVENGPTEIKQGTRGEVGQLGASWYFSRREIEENSPSRRDGIDLKKESYLRRSYCNFLQELGMKLKVPQVTIATAMVFCHRFYLRQSHAKNDRRFSETQVNIVLCSYAYFKYVQLLLNLISTQTIATVCMFLAGKVEETPRPLKDVILVSYELIHKKDPNAGQRIKQQREIYDKQKELILLGERIVLVTLGFDLNVHHAYKPLVEAIRKFNVSQKSTLPQVAWNFVNDGLRTSLCLQFKPHHIAAGAIFLAAKFLKMKPPSDGDKVWWQDFEVTPRQLEEVSNQMLELYEQNRSPQAQPSEGNEAEGSSAGVRNQRSSARSEGNTKESSAHGHQQASKQSNSKNSGALDAKHTNPGKQISDHNMVRNGNGDHGSSKDRSCQSGGRFDGTDSMHHGKKSLPDHQCSKSSESDLREDKSHPSYDNPNETRDGIPNDNEAPCVSSSMMDAMNKIDKDKVKAALEKRRKSKGDVAVKENMMDDEDLLERELEHGVELAVEDEKGKQDEGQNTCSGSMQQGDIQNADHVENGHHDAHNVPATAEDVASPMIKNEQNSPQLAKTTTAGDSELPINSKELSPQPVKRNDSPLAGRHELDGRDLKRPKLEG
ncbi:hypothetical protein EJB05_01630 [Eragrostis curvula]|uniref:Cyclin-like domain-containing protein n=1 Tax=Eragrostis curvula TaxID=38414 RepID=A0A5J9WSI8_9POAL|nr:hypothetical protein EJB05_01630 [Eragrostis curvula]